MCYFDVFGASVKQNDLLINSVQKDRAWYAVLAKPPRWHDFDA